jgi:hypothetical protein
MLFFELFPLFMLFLSLLVGVRLIMVHREAGRERDNDPDRPEGPT